MAADKKVVRFRLTKATPECGRRRTKKGHKRDRAIRFEINNGARERYASAAAEA